MPKRRRSTKVVRKTSLPAEIKIKVEKDCEEEEALIIQNIQLAGKFDNINKIKTEAEINYEHEFDENGCVMEFMNLCENRIANGNDCKIGGIKIKLEPSEIIDEVLELQQAENEAVASVKEEFVDLAINSSFVEIQVSNVDINIEEPQAKRLKIAVAEIETKSLNSAEKLNKNTTQSLGSSSNVRITRKSASQIAAKAESNDTSQKKQEKASDSSNSQEQKFFNIFDQCKLRNRRSAENSTKANKNGEKLSATIDGSHMKSLRNSIDSKQKNCKKSPNLDEKVSKSRVRNSQKSTKIHNSKKNVDESEHGDKNSDKKSTKDNKKFQESENSNFESMKVTKLHSIFKKQDIKVDKTSKIALAKKLPTTMKKKYHCKLCPKSFDKFISLNNHRIIHNTQKFPCTKCTNVFKSKRNFENHKCPICKICGRTFKFQAKVIRHVTFVHADETLPLFECDLCDKKWRYKISMERHMVSHLEATKNKVHECEVCHKTFKKRMGLVQHMILHVEATLKCDRCGVMFKKIGPFKQHCLKQQCLICPMCPKQFSAKNKMEDHIRNVHTDESLLDLYYCDICGKHFKYRMSITRHVQEHLEEAKFDCEACDKKFKSSITLRDHVRLCHTKEIIACKICFKVMKPHCIYQHMKIVHTDLRNFLCKICDAAFKTKDKLKRHMTTHDKHFKCDYCDRMFASQYECTEHVNWHENPNIYQCPVCQKSFSTRTSLNTHSKLHKGIIRNLKCPHCPFKTHRKESIKYHLTTHVKRDKKLEEKKNWFKCEICNALLKNKSTLLGHHWKVHPAEMFTCDLCGITVKTKYSLKQHVEHKHIDQD